MAVRSSYRDAEPYLTKDGSTIRELMHPDHHDVTAQSLAEATVPVGVTTILHKHHQSEELYYILQGSGLMYLDAESFNVEVGDTICIKPGTPHRITNTGTSDLKVMCSCSPAYSHEDTELLE